MPDTLAAPFSQQAATEATLGDARPKGQRALGPSSKQCLVGNSPIKNLWFPAFPKHPGQEKDQGVMDEMVHARHGPHKCRRHRQESRSCQSQHWSTGTDK